MMVRALIPILFLVGPPALAEPLDLPVAEVFALSEFSHADRAGFERALLAALPSAVVDPGGPAVDADDPYRWALSGDFGAEGSSPRPGAIFGCARYGLATRDLFSEHGFAARETFGLMGAVLPLFDDLEVWPADAVARLHCVFVWDDAEAVRIVPEPAARAALHALFDRVETDTESGQFAPLLGEHGFRLFGYNDLGTSIVWLESGDVILTNGHQQVSFRAFLIGGAV
ncbi:hypothetical protein HKCCE4037_01100 [Rhodobacterales bacterium HKCCE4037]|nr:hypothetical protein [Rhodobacterales bacterium HKCCE4037]